MIRPIATSMSAPATSATAPMRPSPDFVLGEAALVDDADGGAHRMVLGGHEPHAFQRPNVGTSSVARPRGEPIGSFLAELGAQHRAPRANRSRPRCAVVRAAGGSPVGEGDVVVVPIGLSRFQVHGGTLCGVPKRRTSKGHGSMPGSPSMIQLAIASPAPPAAAMPAENPQQWKRLSTSSVRPMIGSASGENGIGPLIHVRMPISPNAGRRLAAPSARLSNRSWLAGNSVGPMSRGIVRQQARVPCSSRR